MNTPTNISTTFSIINLNTVQFMMKMPWGTKGRIMEKMRTLAWKKELKLHFDVENADNPMTTKYKVTIEGDHDTAAEFVKDAHKINSTIVNEPGWDGN